MLSIERLTSDLLVIMKMFLLHSILLMKMSSSSSSQYSPSSSFSQSSSFSPSSSLFPQPFSSSLIGSWNPIILPSGILDHENSPINLIPSESDSSSFSFSSSSSSPDQVPSPSSSSSPDQVPSPSSSSSPDQVPSPTPSPPSSSFPPEVSPRMYPGRSFGTRSGMGAGSMPWNGRRGNGQSNNRGNHGNGNSNNTVIGTSPNLIRTLIRTRSGTSNNNNRINGNNNGQGINSGQGINNGNNSDRTNNGHSSGDNDRRFATGFVSSSGPVIEFDGPETGRVHSNNNVGRGNTLKPASFVGSGTNDFPDVEGLVKGEFVSKKVVGTFLSLTLFQCFFLNFISFQFFFLNFISFLSSFSILFLFFLLSQFYFFSFSFFFLFIHSHFLVFHFRLTFDSFS